VRAGGAGSCLWIGSWFTALLALVLLLLSFAGVVFARLGFSLVAELSALITAALGESSPAASVAGANLVWAAVDALEEFDEALRRGVRVVREAELLSRGFRVGASIPASTLGDIRTPHMLSLSHALRDGAAGMQRDLEALCSTDYLNESAGELLLSGVLGSGPTEEKDDDQQRRPPPRLGALQTTVARTLPFWVSAAIAFTLVELATPTRPSYSLGDQLTQLAARARLGAAEHRWAVEYALLNTPSGGGQGADFTSSRGKRIGFDRDQARVSRALEGIRVQVSLCESATDHGRVLAELRAAVATWERLTPDNGTQEDADGTRNRSGSGATLASNVGQRTESDCEEDPPNALPERLELFEAFTGEEEDEEAILAYRPKLTRAERLAKKREREKLDEVAQADRTRTSVDIRTSRVQLVAELQGVLGNRAVEAEEEARAGQESTEQEG
jgi:hypothetical protein